MYREVGRAKDLSARRVELHALVTFLQENSLHYLLNRRLDGHTAGLGPCGKEENLLLLREIG